MTSAYKVGIALSVLIILAWYAYRTYGTAATQSYTIVKETPAYQIRSYGPTLYAHTTVEGELDEALSTGFRRLASYIFAEKIEMTAPVLFKKADKDHRWHMRFVLPERFLTKSPPAPTDSAVTIIREEARHVAAVCIPGAPSYKTWQENDAKLTTALGDEYSPCESSWFARYDAPWIPSFMRRNEILRITKKG